MEVTIFKQFILFLVILGITSILVVNLVLKIVRSVNRYPNYGTMVSSPSSPGKEDKGGSSFLFILLVLVTIIFFVVLNRPTDQSTKNDNEIETHHKNSSLFQTSKKNTASEMVPLSSSKPKEDKLINISPKVTQVNLTEKSKKTTVEKFGIQVGAFQDLEYAQEFKLEINTNQIVDIIEGYEGIYKVVIGEFDTRAEALSFKDRAQLQKGFVFPYLLTYE